MDETDLLDSASLIRSISFKLACKWPLLFFYKIYYCEILNLLSSFSINIYIFFFYPILSFSWLDSFSLFNSFILFIICILFYFLIFAFFSNDFTIILSVRTCIVSGDCTTSSKPAKIALDSISFVIKAEQAVKYGQKFSSYFF